MAKPQRRVSARYDDALAAWYDGDYQRCLDMLDHHAPIDEPARVNSRLLRTRALIRLGRLSDAESALPRREPESADARATAAMLRAAIEIRTGDVEGAQGLLRSAAAIPGVHATVLAEIAFYRGLAHYAASEFDAADAALATVGPDHDIVSARAIDMRGWVATARGRYAVAAEAHAAAVAQLNRCRAIDRHLQASVLSSAMMLGVETLSLDMAARVRAAAATMPWTDAMRAQRWQIEIHAALACDIAGRPLEAMQVAEASVNVAPSLALAAGSLAILADICGRYGEPWSSINRALDANRMITDIPDDELRHDDRFALLGVAQSLPAEIVGTSRALFERYRSLRPAESLLALARGRDLRLVAEEAWVDGVIRHREGGRDGITRMRAAFDTWVAIGYLRPAAVAAKTLLRLAPRDEYVAALRRARDGAPHAGVHLAWTTGALREYDAWAEDDVMRSLTPTLRSLVPELCSASSFAAIATDRNRTEKRIRNAAQDVYRAFGVRSRGQLIAACRARGLLKTSGF